MEKLISIRYGKFVKVYRGWFEVRLVDLLVGGPLFKIDLCLRWLFRFEEVFGSWVPRSWWSLDVWRGVWELDFTELVESGCLRAGFHGDGGVLMFGEVFESWVPRSWWSLDVWQDAAFTLGSLVEGRGPNQIVQRRWVYSNHLRMVVGN